MPVFSLNGTCYRGQMKETVTALYKRLHGDASTEGVVALHCGRRLQWNLSLLGNDCWKNKRAQVRFQLDKK